MLLLIQISRLRRRGGQAQSLFLIRIVKLIDVACPKRRGLLRACICLIPRVVFRVAIEPVLNEHTEGEKQYGYREESPVARESHRAREPEDEDDDGHVQHQVAYAADP